MNNRIAFLVVASIFLFSCNKYESTEITSADNNYCQVSLNLIGEITTSESEITKASTTSNNLYGVQVLEDGQRFAWGIFDDISCMSINMRSGHDYCVRVCMVKDAKSHISYYSLTNGGVDTGLTSGPFYVQGTSYFTQSNVFFYNSNNSWRYYKNSTDTNYSTKSNTNGRYNGSWYESNCEFTQIRQGKLNDVNYPTCTDWFYGEVGGYFPSGEFGTISIPLKRTGFKLKYELSGVTDGSVTVKIYNGTRTFFENTTTTSSYASDTQFIAFYDTYSAWQYADNYTENMTVAVTWVRGIGITQNLGTKTVQIKRNCLNNIKITLGSDDRGAGVSLSAEAESSMGSAENNIPVQ